MLRAHLAPTRFASRRLAFLTLAGGLLVTAGCGTFRESDCQPRTGWFSHFHLTSRSRPTAMSTGSPCPCEGGMPTSGMPMTSDGTMIVPPNATLPPTVMAPQNGFVAPPPNIINLPAAGEQPPRVQPVPQAIPTPYTPTPR